MGWIVRAIRRKLLFQMMKLICSELRSRSESLKHIVNAADFHTKAQSFEIISA